MACRRNVHEVARGRNLPIQADANALFVRLELQADCFAGVWAHNVQEARRILAAGDIAGDLYQVQLEIWSFL